jgi:hypothetical protein
VQDKIHTLLGTAWLKYFAYQLVPLLPPNYKEHILPPAKVGFVANTPTNKSEVALLSQLILFSHYFADKRNYCTS